MKKKLHTLFLILCLLAGCISVKEEGNDSGVDTGGPDAGQKIDFDKVDMLVVVDNSQSMEEEQVRLAESFRNLVNSLIDPPASWKVPPVDDIRVGVVTSDMGTGTDVFDYRLLKMEVRQCDPCCPCGDEAKLQCVDNDACDGGAPPWLESTPDNPDEELADEFASLARAGTDGCDFQMQLFAASYALQRVDQKEFLRGDNALLVIIIVSAKDDCSAQCTSSFWGHYWEAYDYDEDLYCAEFQHDLIPVELVTDNIKRKGDDRADIIPGSVVFAGIVGVPMVDGCQGKGNEIAGCLDLGEMEYAGEEDEDGDHHLGKTCFSEETNPDTGEPETSAVPGRRFVELAQKFGENGYIYSICNEDWSPAMKDIARRIATIIGGK